MAKYVCSVCGYEYDEAAGDPDNGIAPGTKWEDIPEDFTCPLCGGGKDQFNEKKKNKKERAGLPAPLLFAPSAVCFPIISSIFHSSVPVRRCKAFDIFPPRVI